MTTLTQLDLEALYEPPYLPPFQRLIRRVVGVLTLLLALMVLFAPFLAFAQDVPIEPVPAELGPVAAPPLPAGVPSLETAPVQFAGVLLQLAQTGRWGAFASLAVFAAVALVRRFAKLLPAGKVRDAILSKWGGWAVNFVSALSAGFAALTFVGAPITLVSVIGVLGGAVSYMLGAAGLVELQADLTERRKTAATHAGADAAAVVDTKAEAIAVLAKGPPEA